MPHDDARLHRALRLADQDTELKIRALSDGTLLWEAQLGPRDVAAGYLFLHLNVASEALLRTFLADREDARQQS
jgi:hypothetical protein